MTQIVPQQVSNPPSFSTACRYWLTLGLVSFGGPAGQIAIMHQDLVERKAWISEQRFLNALNYCMLLPGPEAQQLATYVGWLLHGVKGGLVAGLLFILPGALMMLALSFVYAVYGHQQAVVNVFAMLKPAVVAIVAFAAYRMGNRVLRNRLLWALAIVAFLAMAVFNLAFPYVLMCSALIGLVASYRKTAYFLANPMLANASHAQSRQWEGSVPLTTQRKCINTLYVVLIATLCWAIPFIALLWLFGADGLYTQMAIFFTKMAWLTFGGAYAVLPYVNHAVVEQYAWLNATQMMDGLALGESTPGPLILVITYVGFLAGWAHGVLDSPLASAMLAACVATYFTFLPSFLLIFAGAPWLEDGLNNLQLNGVLAAISASIIGVIAALAVAFAHHLYFASGVFDGVALAFTLLAFVLMAWGKLSVLRLIVLYAGFGLLHYFFSLT